MESPLNKKIQRGENRKAAPSKKVKEYKTLHEKVLSLVQASNASVREERRVTPRSALTVMDRALESLSSLSLESREAGALREVAVFISTATNTFSTNSTKHTDLLMQGHPLSALNASLTPAEYREKYATWLAADSAVNDNVRALVASAHAAEPGSIEREHAFSRLLVTKKFVPGYFKIDVLEAITAAFGSGNSSAARRARVALQWRDRKGRWVEMGRGVNFNFRMPDGSVARASGTYVGVRPQRAGENYTAGLMQVSGDANLPDGIYAIRAGNAQTYSARLTTGQLRKAGITRTRGADQNTVNIPTKDELIAERLDAPIGWTKVDDNTFTSDDNYTIKATDGEYTLYRQNEDGSLAGKVGQGANWADINDLATNDQEAYDVVKGQDTSGEQQVVKARLDARTAQNAEFDRLENLIDSGVDQNGNKVPAGWEGAVRPGARADIEPRRIGADRVLGEEGLPYIEYSKTYADDNGNPVVAKAIFMRDGKFYANDKEYDSWDAAEADIPNWITAEEDKRGRKLEPVKPEEIKIQEILLPRFEDGPSDYVRFGPEPDDADYRAGFFDKDGNRLPGPPASDDPLPALTDEQNKKIDAEIRNLIENPPAPTEMDKRIEKLLKKTREEWDEGKKNYARIQGEVGDFSSPEDLPTEGVIEGTDIRYEIRTGAGQLGGRMRDGRVRNRERAAVEGQIATLYLIGDTSNLTLPKPERNGNWRGPDNGDRSVVIERPSAPHPMAGDPVLDAKKLVARLNEANKNNDAASAPQVSERKPGTATQDETDSQDIKDVDKALDFLDKHMDEEGSTEDRAMGISQAQDHLKEAKKDLESGDVESAISSLEDAFNLMDGLENPSEGIFPNGENSAEAVDVVNKLITRLQEDSDGPDEPPTPPTDGTPPKTPTPSQPSTPGLFNNFDVPNGAFQLRTVDYEPEGRVDEASTNFTDDPKKLATQFTPQDLVSALSEALVGTSDDAAIAEILNANVDDAGDIPGAEDMGGVDIPRADMGRPSGAGRLEFNAGEEYVPMEALYNAVWEAGLDPNRVVANIYDSVNGNNNNLNRLIEAQGGVRSPEEAQLVDDITAEIRQIKSASPDSVSSANKKDKPLPEEDPLPGQLIENVPIDFENPDYYIPDSNAYIPSQPEVDENGFTDNPEILSRDYETADLIDQMIAGITDGSGAALLSFDDITVEVPVEALRDAIQLQDINTNDILLELKRESNDMSDDPGDLEDMIDNLSDPESDTSESRLQAHSQMIRDLIEQTGNTVDDETADKIRDAINQEGLLDWSEADDAEIIEAITEVAGPDILRQPAQEPEPRRFPPTTGERQAIERPVNPPAPIGPFDTQGLNNISSLIRTTFPRGFTNDNKIVGIYENSSNTESMLVLSRGEGTEPILFRWQEQAGLFSFTPQNTEEWFASENAQALGWRAPTDEEQAGLRGFVSNDDFVPEAANTPPRYAHTIDFSEINSQQQFTDWLEENGLQNDIRFRSIRPNGVNSEVSFEFINNTTEVKDRFAKAYNDSDSWNELVDDIGGDSAEEIPTNESVPVVEEPAAEVAEPALAYPGPENRGYHPDNTVLDRTGKVMGKGTRIRASRDGRTGTVIAVQNIDNRTGERIPYVRVRFDDGTVAVRSALKVRATGDAVQAVPNREVPAIPPVPTNIGDRLDAPVVNPGAVATDGSIAGVANLGELPEELQGLGNPDAVQTDFAAWGDRAGEIAFAGRNRVSLDNLRKLNVEYSLATLAASTLDGDERTQKRAEAEAIKERLDKAVFDTFGIRDGVTFGNNGYTLTSRGVSINLVGTDEASITRDNVPMSFTTSMSIKDSDGRTIGTVNRTLSYVSRGDGTPGYWKVKNDYLSIDSARDKKSGFATAYNRYMEDWYIANGVKEIHVQAAGGGSYQGAFVWALNGFNWETPGSAENDLGWRLQRMRREANTDQERAAIDRLKQRADQAKIPGGGVDLDKAPTPMELALVGWYPGATNWLGKKFMSENTGWMGVKRLDPTRKEQIQAINYDQIRRARSRIKDKLNRPGVSREFVLKANSDEFLANNQTLTPYIEEIRSAFQNNTSLATLSPAAKTALSRWVGDQIMAGDNRTLPLTDAFRLRTALDAEAAADNPRAGQTDFGVGNLLASADFEDISKNRLPGFTVRRLGTEESGYNDTYLVKHTDSGQIFYVKKDELAKQYRIDPLRAEIEAGMLTRALGFQGMYETRANIKDASGEVLVMQQAGSSLPLASEPQTLSNVFENGGIQGPDGIVPVTRSTLLDSLRTPEDAVRIALLDLIINNQDRHNGNVLLAIDGTDPSRLRMLPIDHSLAQMAPSDTFNFEQVLSTYDNVYSNTIPVLLQRMGQDELIQAFRNEADKLVASLRSDAFSPSGNELRIIIDRYGSLNAYRDAIEARTAELLTPGTRNFEQFKDILTASYWR